VIVVAIALGIVVGGIGGAFWLSPAVTGGIIGGLMAVKIANSTIAPRPKRDGAVGEPGA
jgi:hypothetical protein